jgi:DAK2 domain fusion protein YloV
VLDALDAAAVRRWCTAGLEALQRSRGEIDHLNVYPVPDRDTGTNLVLTMQSVADALQAADGPADLAVTVKAMSTGALTGARGNSGVILSGFLRGFGESVRGGATTGGAALVQALERAADAGYAAVAEPVEGTVLTVARAAAQAARAARSTDLATVAQAAAKGAHEALSRTPSQLGALARAGVVDAGGRGLCVLLDSLVTVVTGEPAAGETTQSIEPRPDSAHATDRGKGDFPYAYEVQYLLDAAPDSVPPLTDALRALGDSVAVAGADGTWNVHAHVDDVGAAVEAGLRAGRPRQITVTRFNDPARTPSSRRSVVALAPAGLLATLFDAAGAVVVHAGHGSALTAADLLAAIEGSGAAEIVVLPNDAAARAAADEAARLARGHQEITVAVVPTRSLVQGLAALGVHDPGCPFADDVIAMSAAAAGTRSGEVSIAAARAQTSAGGCEAGDVLGVLEGDVALIGREAAAVSVQLLDRMLAGGGELVTVVTAAAAGELGDHLREHVRAHHPAVETVSFVGDGSDPLLMIGVE